MVFSIVGFEEDNIITQLINNWVFDKKAKMRKLGKTLTLTELRNLEKKGQKMKQAILV